MSTTAKKPTVNKTTPPVRSSQITAYTIQQAFAELEAALIAEGEAACLVIDIRATLAAVEAEETLSGLAGEPTDLRRARVIHSTAELRRALADAEVAARQARTRLERARDEQDRIGALLSLRKPPHV